MAGIPLSVVNPTSWQAAGTIVKYDACVSNAEGTVIATNADNDAGFVGFAQNAAVSGEAVSLSGDGSITKARAYGTSVAIQEYLVTSGSTGGAGEVVTASDPTAATQNIVAQALEASDTDTQEIIVLQRVFRDWDVTDTA